MKPKQKLKTSLAMASTLMVLLNYTWAQPATTASKALTVDETLGAAFLGEPAWNVYALANLDAKPSLFAMLSNKKAEEQHPAALRLLAFVADDADAKRLEQWLKTKFAGELTSADRLTVQALFESLGIMSSRGVKEAGDILDKMVLPSYWDGVALRWPTGSKAILDHRYETVAWVVLGYALSDKSDLEDIISVILAGVSEDAQRKELEFRLDPKRMKDYAKKVQEARTQPVPPEIREALVHLFNNDIENPQRINITNHTKKLELVSESATKSGVATNVTKPLLEEALCAYTNIQNSLLAGDLTALAKHLADNGKPMLSFDMQTSEAISARADKLKKMARDLETTKKMVLEVRSAGLSFGEVQGELRPDGTIIIRIPCVGSREAKNRHLAQHQNTRTTDGEGQLVIYMIKQGDQWYWNPFGW